MLRKSIGARIAITSLTITGLVIGACSDGGPGHPEGIGNPCDEDADCPTRNCYLGPAGGYCTAIANSSLSGCEPDPG